MKKEMKLAAMLMIALFAIVLGSCTSDELLPQVAPVTQESEEWHTIDVNMNISRCDFDAGSTRAVSDGTGWKDGDVIYLLFKGANGQNVIGNAKYIASDDRWSLNYYGNNFQHDTNAKVQAYFFDGVTTDDTTNEKVTIPPTTGVYVDLSGSYVYQGGSLNIAVSLKPETSRIRFKGNAGTSIKVGGVKYYTTLTRITGEMTQSSDAISQSVQDNGYTSYIYGVFSNETMPVIAVENSNITYVADCADCAATMLQKGQSGWMNIPTENNHNGWMTLPSYVSGVKTDKTSLYLEPGKTATLTATILPSNAYAGLTWSSSDNSIATIDDMGKVTAISIGKATITATSRIDGSKTATCLVTVAIPQNEDLGLPSGTLWAIFNLGAISPEDYGDYFAWGEISTKDTYTRSNYIYTPNGDLPLSNDAARANWGGSWKMPTHTQWEELVEKCTWTWTTLNSKNGYRVTGPNGNSIFIPAAGVFNSYYERLTDIGSDGCYWSSTYYTSAQERGLCFRSTNILPGYIPYAYYGLSIRPVLSN